MAQYNSILKRLQHALNALDSPKSLPSDELIQKSIKRFSSSSNKTVTFSRPVENSSLLVMKKKIIF